MSSTSAGFNIPSAIFADAVRYFWAQRDKQAASAHGGEGQGKNVRGGRHLDEVQAAIVTLSTTEPKKRSVARQIFGPPIEKTHSSTLRNHGLATCFCWRTMKNPKDLSGIRNRTSRCLANSMTLPMPNDTNCSAGSLFSKESTTQPVS